MQVAFPQKSAFGTLTATKIICPEFDTVAGFMQFKVGGFKTMDSYAAALDLGGHLDLNAGGNIRDATNAEILIPDHAGAIAGLANVANAPTFNSIPVKLGPLEGVANKEWVPCSFTGEIFNFGYEWKSSDYSVINLGADDPTFIYFVSLPTTLYGKKLYLKNVRVTLVDADATNFITRVDVIGILYGATISVNNDPTDIVAAEKKEYTFTAASLDGYAHAYIKIACTCADAGALDIEAVEVEAYYDT